jgi:hypothetical protein
MNPRLLDERGKEIKPYHVITITLKLQDWVNPAAIRAFTQHIEKEAKVPVFTNRTDKAYVLQLFVKHLDVDLWKRIEDENDVEVYVTDARRL